MSEDQSTAVQTSSNSNKPVWQSKTVIGILIMLAMQVAALAGFQVTPDDASSLTDSTDQLVTAGVSFFGAALALYGRAKATKQIGSNNAK